MDGQLDEVLDALFEALDQIRTVTGSEDLDEEDSAAATTAQMIYAMDLARGAMFAGREGCHGHGVLIVPVWREGRLLIRAQPVSMTSEMEFDQLVAQHGSKRSLNLV